MKIAEVVSTYPPYKGGMGNVAHDHVRALEGGGNEVEVFTSSKLFSFIKFGNAAWLPQLAWKLRKFDAVELHYPFFGGAEFVLLWKKIFGKNKKLVVTYHMDPFGKGVFKLIFTLYRWIFLKAILRSADKIIVTSKDYFSSSQASEFKDDPRVSEVPIWVDNTRFTPAEIRDTSTAIFVGGLDKAHYFKGVEGLLRAFSLVNQKKDDAKMIIVGSGDMQEGYEKISQELNIDGKVKFAGRVSDDELPDMYKMAGFIVLPSLDRSEAFGLVLLEAAATGLPAIASNLAGVRSVIREGESGLLVPPGNVDRLADAMLELFSNREKADSMGEKALSIALEKYSPEKVHIALLKIFE